MAGSLSLSISPSAPLRRDCHLDTSSVVVTPLLGGSSGHRLGGPQTASERNDLAS